MNKIFHTILFIGFFLQALIPVGFMPSFANDGSTFVICSGVTGEPVTLTYEDEHHSNEELSAKCPYYNIGASIQASLPASPLLDIAYISTSRNIAYTNVTQSFAQSNFTRGPPHISLT